MAQKAPNPSPRTSLHRELDFRQEAENIERMRSVLEGYDRLAVPSVYRDLSTSRLLLMEEIQGVPIAQAPEGPQRTQAARQLLESFYRQILVEGFFPCRPPPRQPHVVEGAHLLP